MTAFFEIAAYTYRKTLGLLLFCIKGVLVGFLQLVTVENGGWGSLQLLIKRYSVLYLHDYQPNQFQN